MFGVAPVSGNRNGPNGRVARLSKLQLYVEDKPFTARDAMSSLGITTEKSAAQALNEMVDRGDLHMSICGNYQRTGGFRRKMMTRLWTRKELNRE